MLLVKTWNLIGMTPDSAMRKKTPSTWHDDDSSWEAFNNDAAYYTAKRPI